MSAAPAAAAAAVDAPGNSSDVSFTAPAAASAASTTTLDAAVASSRGLARARKASTSTDSSLEPSLPTSAAAAAAATTLLTSSDSFTASSSSLEPLKMPAAAAVVAANGTMEDERTASQQQQRLRLPESSHGSQPHDQEEGMMSQQGPSSSPPHKRHPHPRQRPPHLHLHSDSHTHTHHAHLATTTHGGGAALDEATNMVVDSDRRVGLGQGDVPLLGLGMPDGSRSEGPEGSSSSSSAAAAAATDTADTPNSSLPSAHLSTRPSEPATSGAPVPFPSSATCGAGEDSCRRRRQQPQPQRYVQFSASPPTIHLAAARHEYDRSPHPIVIRLNYADVLELREMRIELGIITRRQVGVGAGGAAGAAAGGVVPGGGGAGGSARRASPSRANATAGPSSGSRSSSPASGASPAAVASGAGNPLLRQRVSSLRSDRSASGSESSLTAAAAGHFATADLGALRSPTSSLLLDGSDQDSTYCPSPSSPSAWASAFPTSSRLISRLNEMGDLFPPEPEAGMGMTVEPTFGLDGRMDAASMRLAEAAAAADRGRRLARKNSGEFYHRPKAIRRMTEEEAVEDDDDVESEFQRELRLAREELEVKAQEQFRSQQVEERDRWKLKAAQEAGTPRTAPQAASKSALFFSTPIILSGPRDVEPRAATTAASSSDSSTTASPAKSDVGSRPQSSGSSTSDGSLGDTNAGLAIRKTLHSPLPERDPSPLVSPKAAAPLLPTEPSAAASATSSARPRVGNSIFDTTVSVPAPFARTSALADSRVTTRRELKPPSPILAPFARSAPLSSLAV